jgi:spermidine synthase
MVNSERPDHIKIHLIDTADPQDIKALYKDAGWWEDEYEGNEEFLETLSQDSAIFAAAFDKEIMVGMGRALSDLKSDAYIQDVVVLKPYRGMGIGGRIIQILVNALQKQGVDWIGLVGEPGTGSFYRRLGFREMKDHIPFKYEG